MRNRMFITALILFPFAMLSRLSAQVEHERTQNILNRPQAFFFDALNFAQIDSFGMRSRIDLYVKIPYDIIRFIKHENRFMARYSLTAIFSDEHGGRIKEELWKQQLTHETYEATIAQHASDISQRNFILQPGPVVMEIIFEDGESGKEYRLSKRIDVKKYDPNLFGMSDLMIVSRYSEAGGRKIITPHVASNVAALKNEFYLFFEMYNPFLEQQVVLQYDGKSSKNINVFTRSEKQIVKQGRNTFISKISQGGFDVGSYTLTVSVRRADDSTANAMMASSRASFIMEWLSEGTPVSINDLDAAVEQLRYFAAGKDLDYIKEAQDSKEKRRRFEEFWERQNPNPGSKSNVKMIEYYNRVAYANEHFKHFLEGWRSDRGMVYIINGPPSYVERHPFEVETKPYEVWEYYDINRRYVFVDESGFGDYRLLIPMWDERTRIR